MRLKYLAPALLVMLPGMLAAQSIDKPAATVRLHKVDVISVRQLRSHITLLESRTNQPIPTAQRPRVLDLLLGEKLIDQAAANDRVVVTDGEVAARIELA